jgi:hypothetical protein
MSTSDGEPNAPAAQLMAIDTGETRLTVVSGDRYRVVCWIDTRVAKSPPPGPDSETRRSFDRAVVGIRAGTGK